MNKRKEAAELIYKVLSGQLTVENAIKFFPRSSNDKSLVCAFHALTHYEADEEIRQKDPEFKEEQNKYLIDMANTLYKNEALPQNIINEYEEFYQINVIPEVKGIKDLLKNIFRFMS